MRYLNNVFNMLRRGRQAVQAKVTNVAAALLLTVFSTVGASAVEVIPTTGVAVDGWITAAITAMGAVVAVAVGGYFAFLIIKKALRWAGRAIG